MSTDIPYLAIGNNQIPPYSYIPERSGGTTMFERAYFDAMNPPANDTKSGLAAAGEPEAGGAAQ